MFGAGGAFPDGGELGKALCSRGSGFLAFPQSPLAQLRGVVLHGHGPLCQRRNSLPFAWRDCLAGTPQRPSSWIWTQRHRP